MSMTFGDKLKAIRTDRGMSQDEFATLLGTSKQVISRYETNQRTPKITVVNDYAEILNVPLNYLLDNYADSIEAAQRNVPDVNNDPELTEYLEELRTRPEMRMMFDLAKNATKEDVEKAVKIIEALFEK